MQHIMKVLCFSIPLLLYISELICSLEPNVGTVLFTKGDLCKKCWTESEKKLLMARQIMEGVLPDPYCVDITRAGAISVLLEYFESCYDAIEQCCSGKSQYIMYLGLSDALGGYLRAYILPITKEAYYAGRIKYMEARKIFQFYQTLKEFLRTDGDGWALPREPIQKFCPMPLRLSATGCETACSQLYLKDQANIEVNKSQNCTAKNNLVSTSEAQTETLSATICMAANATPVYDFSKANESDHLKHDVVSRQRLMNLLNTVKNSKISEANNADYDTDPSILNFDGRNIKEIEKLRKQADELKQRLLFSNVLSPDKRVKYCGKKNDSRFHMPRRKSIFKRACRCRCRQKITNQGNCWPEQRQLIVPLPVLDDAKKPNAIGVPFRTMPLRNLQSPQSVCILVRYYITVIKCLISKNTERNDLMNFNAQFRSWLISEIVPHLSDEDWYPAFGGVLRIIVTINSMGYSCNEAEKPRTENDCGYIFQKGFGFNESLDDGRQGECECKHQKPSCYTCDNRTTVTLIVLAVVFVWIFILCSCLCCCRPSERSCDETKKVVEPSDSYLVQCLVRFFKRSENEALSANGISDNESSAGSDEDADDDGAEVDDENDDDDDVDDKEMYDDGLTQLFENKQRANRSSKMLLHDNAPSNGTSDDEMYSDDGARYRRHRRRQAIVNPALVSQAPMDLPLGLTSFWPFTDFGDNIKPYPTDCATLHPCEAKNHSSKLSKKDGEQFRTLWRREKLIEGTSESCPDASARKEIQISSGKKSKQIEEAAMSGGSSYTEESLSEDLNQKHVMFAKKSERYYNYPRSCRYSCNSSPKSYTSSEADDVQKEFYDHIAACHSAFAKRIQQQLSQKSEVGSDSSGASTSTSESSTNKCEP